MYFAYGIPWLLILILDIYVIMRVLSTSMDPVMKLVWIIVILLLPLLGPILYLLIGAKKA
jgi:hypothetical protein